MTPARITRNARPSRDWRGLQPMDPEQARFWQLRREYAERKENKL